MSNVHHNLMQQKNDDAGHQATRLTVMQTEENEENSLQCKSKMEGIT